MSALKWIREKPWYVIWAHAGVLHLELRLESKHAPYARPTWDLIDDTLWHDFICQVRFCPLYSCTVRYFSVSRNCGTWCRSLLLSFSTCYLGILGLEGAINYILAWTSHQRTTSKKRTKALLPKCPLFGGSTVLLVTDIQEVVLVKAGVWPKSMTTIGSGELHEKSCHSWICSTACSV